MTWRQRSRISSRKGVCSKMGEVMVLIEHRQGEMRAISLEMLSKGQELAEKTGAELTAVLLGKGTSSLAEEIQRFCHHTLSVEDERLSRFNSEPYQDVLTALMNKRNPSLVLIGHTAFGMDIAPALATAAGIPLATDCYDIAVQGSTILAYRQMYGGKMCAEVHGKEAPCTMITVRSGSFPSENLREIHGVIEEVPFTFEQDYSYKKFLRYLEAAVGGVDITQADVIVSVGRGIGGPENLSGAEELASLLGGVVACSRPVADKQWLPKERQVGTSGKTVKPKFYIALGISGAFQHIAGMQNAATIIAINKDAKAPIFNVAHYGIVGDLLKVVPDIVAKVRERKGA
jgi:electron transfer flavoprotein alpha subunit